MPDLRVTVTRAFIAYPARIDIVRFAGSRKPNAGAHRCPACAVGQAWRRRMITP
jgi:hypothetical protein